MKQAVWYCQPCGWAEANDDAVGKECQTCKEMLKYIGWFETDDKGKGTKEQEDRAGDE